MDRDDYLTTLNRLQENLAFSRSLRQQSSGVNREMWHNFVRDDVNRLNAHIASRTTQIQLNDIASHQDANPVPVANNPENSNVGRFRDCVYQCGPDAHVPACKLEKPQ